MSSSRPRGSRSRFNIRLVALLLVAVAVFLGVIVAVGSLTRSYTVIVATQIISSGTPLADGQFAVVHVNGDAPSLEGSTASRPLNDADLDLYRGLLLTNTIYPGSILQTGDFYAAITYDPAHPEQSYATRLTQLLGKDARALVIEGDPTSTFVQVGDYIDIIWLPNFAELNTPVLGPDGNPLPLTTLYTNSAQRLFTKRVIYAVPRPAIDPAVDPAGQTTGTVFILDMSAQESQDLIWAQANGTLRITLASPESVSGTGTTVTTPDYFNNLYNIVTSPAPSVSPTPTPAIETPPPSPSGVIALPSASPAP